jgi:hypothetical protein
MKKIIYALMFCVVGVMSTNVYCSTAPSEKHEFKESYNDINFDIERKSGEVVLHFQSSLFKNYDEIIVERSSENSGGYTACKVISLSEVKLDGDYYRTSDKFPVSAKMTTYYRIKTISKEGITKIFPPLELTPLSR